MRLFQAFPCFCQLQVLDVPDPDALAHEFPEKLPCEAYPSDHLCLVADLLIP